ncbi:MAG: hypothetical protein E6I88_10650 [Chloroflexi bacterium]|nr:MAG: hypothetical protein E6I88_10650 [Chloroflexota bacterium]TME44692.1 MAG: hypothetical protein E6I56_11485 [Chloroflexota bacterium]
MGAFLIGGFIVLAVAVVLTFTACAAIVISELWSTPPVIGPLALRGRLERCWRWLGSAWSRSGGGAF